MAGSTATMLGKGTTLSYAETATPTIFVVLTKVTNISPSHSVGEVEDVTLESTFTDYQPTIGEGECGFTLRFRPGDPGVKRLQVLSATPERLPWKVTYSDGSSMTFTGFLKQLNKSFENKTIVDYEASIRICTQPVYAEAT